MEKGEPIRFYLVNEPYGQFSNFARFRIWLKDKSWPTSEHYFQAMKFDLNSDQEEIRQASSPKEAAEKGRDRKRKLKPNWDSIRDDIMRDAVWAKFTQHEELKHLLVSTGESILVEHTRNDAYWADGGDGTGKNMLGTILMETREKLRFL
jgi:ribA/ribD-fused uncharacterized protein